MRRVHAGRISPMETSAAFMHTHLEHLGSHADTGSSKPARAEVVPLEQGQALIFAVNSRPARSARGFCKLSMRHGVSRLHRGERHTLGIIFHDAK